MGWPGFFASVLWLAISDILEVQNSYKIGGDSGLITEIFTFIQISSIYWSFCHIFCIVRFKSFFQFFIEQPLTVWWACKGSVKGVGLKRSWEQRNLIRLWPGPGLTRVAWLPALFHITDIRIHLFVTLSWQKSNFKLIFLSSSKKSNCRDVSPCSVYWTSDWKLHWLHGRVTW